jgi:hypothetical protein
MSHEQSTIIKDELLVLRASAAGTAVVDGTGIPIGPTNLVKAVVNITALATGGTLAISIQESDVLASGYVSIAAFPVVLAAVGLYELPFRASKKYVRYSTTAVHGTESITYEILVTTVEK